MCSPAGSAGWGKENNKKIRKVPPTHPSHMFFKVGFIGLDFNPAIAFGSYSNDRWSVFQMITDWKHPFVDNKNEHAMKVGLAGTQY